MVEPTHRRFGLMIAAALFVADQVTKFIITGPVNLKVVQEIYLLPIFQFTWTENRGVALGMFTAGSAAGRWSLVVLTAAIAGFVTHWLWKERRRGDVVGLGLILGGALGNIVDRVRYGYVVDFLDLHFGDFRPFLIFNLADAAISVGVVILLLRAFFVREPRAETETDNA